MTVFVFTARGATEPLVGNMIDQVTRQLKHVTVEEIPHTASMSINNANRDPLAPSGDNSATQVVDWLNARTARLTPSDRFIVLGHSLGSVGVTRWLKQTTDHRCLMVGHIANPSRRAGVSYGMPARPGTSGIYAPWGTVPNDQRSTIPVYEIANPGDVITSCPASSPLHAFAGPVMAASLRDPGKLIDQLRTRGIEEVLMNIANIRHWTNPSWWSWPADLNGFASGQHTTAYSQPMWRDSNARPVSGIDLLARVCQWRAGQALKAAA